MAMKSVDVLPGFMACPACDGSGAICDGRRIPASYYQPAEYDQHACDRCGGSGEALDPETDAVDLALVLRLSNVVRNAATRPYVIGSWVPGFEGVGRVASKRIDAYERRRALASLGLASA